MGQASRRGSFEDRKAQSIAKREERQRKYKEACLLRQAELDARRDMEYQTREAARREGKPVIGYVGAGGFGSGNRRGKSAMIMAALLATMGGIGSVMADDRKCL